MHKLRVAVFTCSGHAERDSNCFVMPRGKAGEAPPLINVYESKRNEFKVRRAFLGRRMVSVGMRDERGQWAGKNT